jgi:uncharacterized protein (UPF0261 family)
VIRTNEEEMQTIAKEVAGKLNSHEDKNRVKFVIPTKGFSSLSVEGGALYDPDSDRGFIEALKENLDPEIEVIEVDTHINTPEFGRSVVDALNKIL